MQEVTFWRCKHCGNLFYTVNDGGVAPMCCGEKMEKLSANTTDAATEKHVPVVERDGNHIKVTVGSVEHPMTPEHYICWIAMVANGKITIQHLSPEDSPKATFCGRHVESGTVYEFCNLHGLWKAEF